jgi:DNA polymerase-3 subunit gamma/tau
MALYHKHRPQLFSTIIGQDHIRETLVNEIKTGKIAHAYLFSGPRGVGKTTTARVLAKAMNCKTRKPGSADPCDTCDSCQTITTGRAIDVIEMDAASHTGVDNVREQIIDTAHFQPTMSPYKIFIIDEVHMLSTSAFNALLKTLEEPPAHLVFILATTELHKLPDTIISRCQRFAFKKIPYDTMKKHLDEIAQEEGVHISAEVMQKIIRKSDGCARDAVNLLDQIMATGEKHITPEVASLVLPTSHIEDIRGFLDGLATRDAGHALEAIHTVAENGLNVSQFALDLIECLRFALIASTGNSVPNSIGIDLSPDDQKAITEFAKTIGRRELVTLVDMALKRRAEIKSAPIPELPLELLAVEWCSKNSETISHPSSNSSSPKITETIPTKTKEIEKMEPEQKKPEELKSEPEPEKKSIVERVIDLVSSESIATLEQAQKAWLDCTHAIEAVSPSLVVVLKMATITKINGNTISLSVPYKFHKDKLEEINNRRKIEKILNDTVGSQVKYDIEIDAPAETPNDIEDMASMFGGEVVGV